MWVPIAQDWATKPPCGTPLRTDGHWSVQGLVGCWLFNEGGGNALHGLVGKDASLIYAPEWKNDGVYTSFSSSSGNYPCIVVPVTWDVTKPFTVMHRSQGFSSELYSHYYWAIDGASNSSPLIALSQYGSGRVQALFNHSQVLYESVTTCEIGVAHTVCNVIVPGTKWEIYYSGKLKRTITSLAATNSETMQYLSIGAYKRQASSVYLGLGGITSFASIYNRALSPAEIASISANPYQVCQP